MNSPGSPPKSALRNAGRAEHHYARATFDNPGPPPSPPDSPANHFPPPTGSSLQSRDRPYTAGSSSGGSVSRPATASLTPGCRVRVRGGPPRSGGEGENSWSYKPNDDGIIVSVNEETQNCEVRFSHNRDTVTISMWNLENLATPGGRSAKRASVADALAELPPPESDPFVEEFAFCLVVAVVVAADSIAIGLETDLGRCKGRWCTPSQRFGWFLADHIFTVAYLVEIILRIVSWGFVRLGNQEKGEERKKRAKVPAYFVGGRRDRTTLSGALHWLDLLIVLSRIVATVLVDAVSASTGSELVDPMLRDAWSWGMGLRLVSMLRLGHLAKFVRLVRLVPAFRGLWLLLAGAMDTAKTVCWVALILVLMVLVLGILLTISLGQAPGQSAYDPSTASWPREEYFGSVPRSMYSLFQMLTGDGWYGSIAGPLLMESSWVTSVFLILILSVFLILSGLGLLNLIVGVVVESTLASAAANAEREARQRQLEDKEVMKSLENIFEEADKDANGDLDRDELGRAVRKPHVRDRLKLLQISVQDLELLFDLLDEDGTGVISCRNFFRGCTRLRGPAMASDLYQMSVDLSRCGKQADKMIADTEAVGSLLSKVVEDMITIDTHIVKSDSDQKDPVLVKRRERARRHAEELPAKRHSRQAWSTGGDSSQHLERRLFSKNSRKHSLVHASLKFAESDIMPHEEDMIFRMVGPPPTPRELLERAASKRRHLTHSKDHPGSEHGLDAHGRPRHSHHKKTEVMEQTGGMELLRH